MALPRRQPHLNTSSIATTPSCGKYDLLEQQRWDDKCTFTDY